MVTGGGSERTAYYAARSDLDVDPHALARRLAQAVVGGLLISALGGSRFQIGGPAGAFIVLIASIVERKGYDGLVLATAMAGLIMIAAGYLRFGTYIKYIPFPVTVGFTAGIAVIIFASQVKDMLGLDIAHEPAALIPKVEAIAAGIGSIRPATVFISVLSIAIIVGVRRVRPNWPGMLIAVGVTAVLTALLHLDVATIGSRFGGVPRMLPAPHFPDVSRSAALPKKQSEQARLRKAVKGPAQLLSRFSPGEVLTREQIQDAIGASKATTNRWIQTWIRDDVLDQTGSGRATRYQIKR